MRCYKCNKELSGAWGAKEYLTPTGTDNLDFCDKCFSEWEGSTCQKNYDQDRLKAWEKEQQKPDNDEAWKETINKEIKAIKTKWNIKDEAPQQKDPGKGKDKRGNGGIIAIAVITAIIVIAVIVWMFYGTRSKKKPEEDDLY